MSLTRRYAILTPSMPAALAAVRLWADTTELASTFWRMPVDGVPVYTKLRDADTGLLTREPGGSWLFTPHGGSGVLAAVAAALEQSGFVRAPMPEGDEALAQDMNRYQRTALGLLPQVHGDGPVRLLLEAIGSTTMPHGLDNAQFAADWPLVKPWLSAQRVALVGSVNAGKSTLFNALAEQGSAIVSDEPGTTRDVLRTPWALPNGCVVELLDTPGERGDASAAPDPERVGFGIGTGFAAGAVLRLRLVPAGDDVPAPNPGEMLVWTKCDLKQPDAPGLQISVLRGMGVDDLEAAVAAAIFPALPQRLLPLSEAMARDASEGRLAEWFI